MLIKEPNEIKIVYFHLAFLYSGGGEKLALKEISLLRKKGYQVDCFTPLLDASICFPDIIKDIHPREIIPGLTKIFHRKPEIGVLLTCILFPFIAYKYRKYQMVIGANQPSPIFGYILKIMFNIPYIIYIAQPTRILFKRPIDNEVGLQIKNRMYFLPHIVNICRPLFYWIDLKSISCANVFLTNGAYMQGILSQIYGKIPQVCSPGASIYKLEKNINKEKKFIFRNLNIQQPYIFMSNRHFPHKKFEYAFEVLDLMENKVPLLISGEPTEYTDQLKKLAKYYNIEKYVYFLGYVTESELRTLYRNCEMYLYTSPEEDFGMGIVEAMAYGKPVIAWDNAGPSKTITHMHDGLLAELGNKQEMKKYIELCLFNKEFSKKVSRNAIKTVKQKYAWQRHISILETQIQKTLLSELKNQTLTLTTTIALENI